MLKKGSQTQKSMIRLYTYWERDTPLNRVRYLPTQGTTYLEEYPSLVEGTGLENREVAQAAQGFESLFLRHLNLYINIAGWSSW